MPFTKINPSLTHALERKGYTSLTPVQEAVLENENTQQDLLVSAQTGSGKTVAYGIAMAHTLLGDKLSFNVPKLPKALIVAPTRELALQVHQELIWLYADTRAKIVICIGGMNVRKEASMLDGGCHIVVGTPGRLCDHVRRRHLDLSDLQVIVLDEADEMLDLGFRDELEELLSACPEEHRTLLFSATIDKEIESLARRYQNKALRINTVSTTQHRDIEYRATITHPKEVDNAVVNLLRYIDSPTAMVFCATRELVRHMQSALIERGFSCVALSGELGQQERNHAIKSLRTGQVRVCVATDVAARGLDLPTLDLVIHASLPTNHATLLHRSGRTGRAGRKGVCALIVPSSQRNRAEQLLNRAKVAATWDNPPTIASIREKDNVRLLENVAQLNSTEILSEDQGLINQITTQFSATDLANAVLSLYRTTIPNPEEITQISLDNRRSSAPSARGGATRGSSPSSFVSGSWFEMRVGRNDKADPKWLIPIICKSGNIQKKDIGNIHITDQVTKFEISAEKASEFSKNIEHVTDEKDRIYPSSPAPASDSNRRFRRDGDRSGPRREFSPRKDREGGGRDRDRDREGGRDRDRAKPAERSYRRKSPASPTSPTAPSLRKRRK